MQGKPERQELPSSATIVILAAVEWGFIAQAQQLLAEKLANRGFNVIFVEPFPHRYPRIDELGKALTRVRRAIHTGAAEKADQDDLPDNLTILSGLGLPETNGPARWINRRFFVRWLARKIRDLATDPLIVQVWKPLDGYLSLARELEPDLLVYSCIENYPHQYTARPHYTSVEHSLLAEADVVIAIAEYVAKRLRDRRPDLHIRDAAVDFDLFDAAATGPAQEYQTLCYFGAVSNRLDYEIIKGLASAGYQIMLLGPVRRAPIDPRDPPANIRCHPPVPIGDVPDLIAEADCLLLPYVLDEYTKGIRFAKLYECFATGKPILATPIPTLERFPELVYLADDLDGFLEILAELPALEQESKYRRRREIARQNTWERRVDEELEWMAEGLRTVEEAS